MANEGERALRRAVRPKVVLHGVGELCVVLGIAALVPVAAAAAFGEPRPLLMHALASGFFFALGGLARRVPAPRDMQRNEALVVTVAVFLLFPLVMSGPLVAEGLPWIDALFEAISGVTTTGLSTLGTLEGRSQTFLLARAWMQWVGGLGFVVLSLALIFDPEAGIRPLHVGTLEPSNVVGSLRLHARRVLGVYLALTGLGVVTLALLGANGFEAIVHTLAAVSTGGFAPRDASLAPLGRPVQAAVLLLGALGSVSLPLYFLAFRGHWRRLRDNPEARALPVFVAVAALALVVGAGAGTEVWDLALLAVSAQTTAGFSTVPVGGLPAFGKAVLIVSMMVGGAEGSTAGGMKLLRVLRIARLTQWLLAQPHLPPHAVSAPRLGGERLETQEILVAAALILLFLGILVVSWLVFLAYGHEPLDALFEVASATGTVGLSVGITGPELAPVLKGVLCTNMLLGRLEVFAVLVALSPSTWLGRRRS